MRVNDTGGDLCRPGAAEAPPPARPPGQLGRGGRRRSRSAALGERRCRSARRAAARGRIGLSRMTRQVYAFEPPERFVAGTVGVPGRAHVLPAGPRRRSAGQRGAGKGPGVAARREARGAARRGAPPLRRRPSERAGPRRPTTSRWTARWTRSSGSARWAWPSTCDSATVVIEAIAAGDELTRTDEPSKKRRTSPRDLDRLRVRLTPAATQRVHRPGHAGWSRPAGRRARCAASRSTRPGTSARGTTATAGDGPRAEDCSAAAGEPDALTLLPHGRIETRGPAGRRLQHHAAGVVVELDGVPARCVYKPVRGERPLWDFPDGTLAGREVAAYVVSRGGRLGAGAADRAARGRAARPRRMLPVVDRRARGRPAAGRLRAGAVELPDAAGCASPPAQDEDGSPYLLAHADDPAGWPGWPFSTRW